jgi:hypothetical protein
MDQRSSARQPSHKDVKRDRDTNFDDDGMYGNTVVGKRALRTGRNATSQSSWLSPGVAEACGPVVGIDQ